jgi:hypothetical protein
MLHRPARPQTALPLAKHAEEEPAPAKPKAAPVRKAAKPLPKPLPPEA